MNKLLKNKTTTYFLQPEKKLLTREPILNSFQLLLITLDFIVKKKSLNETHKI